MNLEKMYDTQKELRGRINYFGKDRFEKLVLALYTELGECANSWRGFKFWSQDQEPREDLLEEYVDGLHFVFELGIEAKCEFYSNSLFTLGDVTEQFLDIYKIIDLFRVAKNAGDFMKEIKEYRFEQLQRSYLGLGIKLGFTFEQIETAYYDKNKVNHQRQDEGY